MKLLFMIILIVITYLLEQRYLKSEYFEDFHNSYHSVIDILREKCNIIVSKLYPSCIEHFNLNVVNIQNNNNIWIYLPTNINPKKWSSFYSRNTVQPIESYKQLCLEKMNNYHSNINIITDNTISKYCKSLPFFWKSSDIPLSLQIDYLKFYILYHYGGIWIKPQTILFQDLSTIQSKLNNYEIITIGNTPKIIAGKKYSPSIKKILHMIHSNIKLVINNYDFINDTETNGLLQHPHFNKLLHHASHYHFSSDYNGELDNYNNPITIQNYLSTKDTVFKNKKKILFVEIPEISSFQNQWFLRLSVNQLLTSNLWISRLLQ